MPDSLSKTIPIWCCVINRAIERIRNKNNDETSEELSTPSKHHDARKEHDQNAAQTDSVEDSIWDTEFRSLPLLVPRTEHQQIQALVPGFVEKLMVCSLRVQLTRLSN
jgi:tRNA A64-2'-O-ribosylphosphate transferase